MWVKIQHQIEVLKPIYMALDMKVLTKMTILGINDNIYFPLFNKTWVLINVSICKARH